MSAASFGVSDFVGGIVSRRMAALRVLLISTPVALALLAILAVVAGGPITLDGAIWGALGGVSQALGVWAFYVALGRGPISVVSPLSAVVDASVPVAVGLLNFGERPGAAATIGIGLALVAVVLISREGDDETVRPHPFTKKVALLAVGSGLALGSNFVFMNQTPAESRLWPLLFARSAATVLVFCAASASRNLRPPTGAPLRLAVFVGLLDTAANVTMLLALHGSLLSLASILIALYPAVTIVLAIVVLRERVQRWQVLGMSLALVAVVLITA